MAGTADASKRVTNFLDRIPGYRGYRAKEDRRDADRRVREHVANAFAAQADRVESVARRLAEERRLREIGPVEQLAQSIRHVVDRIMTASYGYGGLFSDRNVDEIALDQLRKFDESLMSGVEELNEPIAALEQELAAGGDLAVPARAGTAVTQRVLERLNARAEVIETGKPAPEEKLLDLLEPLGAKRQPPPTYSLRIGDAIAILGENFIVDAEIHLETRGRALRLFRIGPASPRWLAVSADPSEEPAVLQEAGDASAVGSEVTIGGTRYVEQWSEAGMGELHGKGGSSGQRSVTITTFAGAEDPKKRAVTVDWETERQTFAGETVHPDDIEIYGPTGTR
ncbi:MAG TPA: hypothetical protein VIL01_14555 [Thermomicrobiales bacterium]